MKRIIGVIAVLAMVLAAAPAAAQNWGNAVYVPIGVNTGINIAGDFAKGTNDASLRTTYFGGRATLGLAAFYVSASVGSVKPDSALSFGAGSQTSFGGTLGYNILRLPMTPLKISAQAGVGYVKEGDLKRFDFPIAVAFGLKLPGPLGIAPWVAPRLHIRYVDTGFDLSSTDTRFGGSAGVNLSFGMIGIHLAADYIYFSADEGSGVTSSDVSPWVFGGGLNIGLNVPGL